MVALIGVWVWWTFLSRKRLIEDLPTSATTGVALGLNELVGRVESAQAAPSPQSGTPCVWWQNTFYVSDGEGGWKKTGDKQGGPLDFDLVDDEGSIPVRPRKAEVSAPEIYDGPPMERVVAGASSPSLVSRYIAQRSAGTKQRRVVEKAIVPGDEVYVLGTAQLPMESLEVYIGPDRERGTDPFFVRVGSEADALFTERVGTVVGAIVAFVAAAASGIALVDGRALADEQIEWTEVGLRMPFAFMIAVLAIMSLASFVFTYNGLRVLRQRADKAWSLIDVQLRRRHDLIPNLVRIASTHADHEREVQTAIAELRGNLAADLPAKPSDDAVADAGRGIRAEEAALDRALLVIEDYPAITADATFAELRAQLIDTENRIALARTFYNNSVTALHDRAATLQGGMVSWVFELDLAVAFDAQRERRLPQTRQAPPTAMPGPSPA